MSENTMSNEIYLKGVRGELSPDVLEIISGHEVPYGDYYDYEALRSVILKKLNGEIDDEYFKNWLYLVCSALGEDEYGAMSWYFDGLCFSDSFERPMILELLAMLKDFDFKLRHEDFITQHAKEKMKVIYLRFEHCNWTAHSSVFKAYFVDFKSKRFDIRFVDDAFFEYRDDINYCFLDEPEADYDDDDDMSTPRELPEEGVLMSYFYSEGDSWEYDHNLEF